MLRKAGKIAEAKTLALRAYRGLAKTRDTQPAWIQSARELLVEMGENVPGERQGGEK